MRVLCFWEKGRFFHKIWEWEHSVSFFKRMDVFLTKHGHVSSYFYVKNWKKRASFFLAYDVLEFWQNCCFFTKYRHGSRGFFMKNLTWEHSVFERMDVFLTKYGHEKSVFFLENVRVFDKNAYEGSKFYGKSCKIKGILLTFLAHNLM